jgi:hypothetical protein
MPSHASLYMDYALFMNQDWPVCMVKKSHMITVLHVLLIRDDATSSKHRENSTSSTDNYIVVLPGPPFEKRFENIRELET